MKGDNRVIGNSRGTRFLTAVLLGLMATAVYAVDPAATKPASVSSSVTSAEVKNDTALLALLSQRSKAIKALEGRFVQQKTIAVLPAPLNSTGRFQFEQGKGVVWELLTPVQNKVELTPKGISFANEQQAAPLPQAGVEVVARIFMGVIAGELDSLNNYFAVQASGDSSRWTLVLTPRSTNLAAYIKSIELQGGELTEQLDIAEANGDHTHITLTTDKVVRN